MNDNAALLLFTALVSGSVGFCTCALLCARVVQKLVEELEEQDPRQRDRQR